MTDTLGVRRCSAALNSRQSIVFADALLYQCSAIRFDLFDFVRRQVKSAATDNAIDLFCVSDADNCARDCWVSQCPGDSDFCRRFAMTRAHNAKPFN